jgi:hypothetical protein
VSPLDTTNLQPNYLAFIQLASSGYGYALVSPRPNHRDLADYVIHRKKNLTRHGIAMSAPPNVPLLDRVRELADSRNLSAEALKQIAAELRAGRRGRIRTLRHLRIHS